jgi:predicted metal-dependent peptidase
MLTNRKLACITPDELWKFIVAEPLLAYFFLRSSIEEIPNYSAVAAVSVVGGKIRLRLNPNAISTFTTREKIGTLVHEYLHVLLQHCTTRLHYREGAKAQKENYAMDMAINQIIRRVWDLPPFAIYHDNAQFQFQAGLSAEEYFKLLDEKFSDDVFMDQFGHESDFDNHAGWENSTKEDSIIIKDMARSYANSMGTKDVGETLAQHSRYSSALESVLAMSVDDIRWESVVLQFVRNVRHKNMRRTYKRPSRRFGFPASGLAPRYTAKIAAIVDTSASMSSTILAKIAGQLNSVSRLVHLDVLMCDSDVSKNGIVKRFKPSDGIDFVGRRGTDLQPAFDLASKDRYSAAICFTDGGFKKKIISKIPTLWVCVGNDKFSPGFGTVINVKY